MTIDHAGPAVGALFRKLQQNWRWSKAQRWAHLIEEHDLNPLIRGKRAVRKTCWRLVHRAARTPAVPIFLVGVQRSGTNLLAHGLDEMPEFQVFNEGNTKAFYEYRLRSLSTVEQLVRQSGARFVLFKPLCDSHRTPELLAHFAPQARAIWAYRNVDGRVRSAVAKFGESKTLLVNYDEFLAEPERVAKALCNFLDQPCRREMIAHVDPRRPGQRPPSRSIRESASDAQSSKSGWMTCALPRCRCWPAADPSGVPARLSRLPRFPSAARLSWPAAAGKIRSLG